MKIDEMKMRLSNTLNSLVDTYFSNPTMAEKFINSTLKVIIKQNIAKADGILELFADKDGEIDAQSIIEEYANMMSDDGIVFDLKDFVGNSFLKTMIPEKVLIIKKEDILSILN